jgi:hypothetical protein
MIKINHVGDLKRTQQFLDRLYSSEYFRILQRYGSVGVSALAANTPKDSGLTSNSWGYQIVISKRNTAIHWTNSNVVQGVPIAIILQYGHATRNGGFVQGRDYINPAMKPIFDQIADDLWKEVSKL